MKLGWKDLAEQAPGEARVLVVEDEPAVRKLLVRIVKDLGHGVKEAASAEAADQWIGAERFDLLLLDVGLPRMSGLEFLRWALERDPELAVIMVTGLDDKELAIECMSRGARTYLVKPIDVDFLEAAVRDALAMRRLLVERNAAAAGGLGAD